MGKILIGWAEESIVPEKKVNLAGQFFERISEHVESEITTTVMAVEADGDCMIIASIDVIDISDEAVGLIREKVKKLTDKIDVNKIMVNATHTHTSVRLGSRTPPKHPLRQILYKFLPQEKKVYKPLVTLDDSVISDIEALEFVTDKAALAITRAWDARCEALYTNEFGRAAVGMCRRAIYNDGSGEMWGDTNTATFVALEGGNDSGIELLYTFDKNRKLTGVVANIACPAQILEQRSFISADFWGRAKAIVREKLGSDVYLLALCGAAGDQCPRDLVRWVQPETPIDDPNVHRPNPLPRKADPSMYDISGCNRAGKRIANEIVSVFEEITELKDEAVLEHRTFTLNLPLRKVTKEDYNHAVRELEYYAGKKGDEECTFEDTARMHVQTGTIARYMRQQEEEILPIETHIIRFGDISISTNPFELFLDYANVIKARAKSEQAFIIQLCCGAHGYLPTEKAEKAGHYSAYVSSGEVGHEGGDLLVRETITNINDMFK